MSQKLMPDSQAPALSLPLVGGGTWTLANQSPKNFTMVIFYRGLHCPVCKMYLEKLKAALFRGQLERTLWCVQRLSGLPARRAWRPDDP